ncbi:MAG: hypothetical protein ACLRVU_01200 [Beduini sp.]|uniref:hypothetical protein n=1 Tax=Beduini sp. TaxID=1922300 RepID=UPI0039A306C2
MNIKETLTKLIKDNNLSHASLAKKMGYKSPSSIGNVVIRNEMKAGMLIDICNELGYEIVIKPKYGDNKAERTIILDESTDVIDNRGKFERG